jgi:hypothetical protein
MTLRLTNKNVTLGITIFYMSSKLTLTITTILLSVVMPNAIILSVVVPNVVASLCTTQKCISGPNVIKLLCP